MRHAVRILTALLGTAVLSAHPSAPAASQPRGTNDPLVLIGGTIYASPSDEPIRGGIVIVRDGKIAAVGSEASARIPSDTLAIDCSGLTITAGFWNSHVHFFERKWADVATIPAPELDRQLQNMLTQYGFTTAFDLGSNWDNTRQLRDRIEAGEVAGPRVLTTGGALVAPGAVPSDAVIRALGYMPFPRAEVTTAEQAAKASKTLLGAGVDGVKVHLQPPPPPNAPIPESAIKAAMLEAHRAGKRVFVHPSNGGDVLAAIRSGVDVIAHTTPASGPWDETILSALKERGIALTPTLTLWKDVLRHDRVSTQDQSVSTSIGQLRAWVASGGKVLFGNDLGAVDYDPSQEYTFMAEAGMSVRQILTSLTTAPAELFGASTRLGRIVPGFAADLAVLSGDPSKDVRAFARVQYTLRGGRIVYRAH